MVEPRDIDDTAGGSGASEVRRSWSGSPWEKKAGYCRALRIGNRVWIAGTAAFEADGSVTAPGDLGAQTARVLEIIAEALRDVGSDISHVVATRTFVTDISRAAEFSEAHGAVFAEHPPVATLVEVQRLVHPDVIVEIEVEAVVPGGRPA